MLYWNDGGNLGSPRNRKTKPSMNARTTSTAGGMVSQPVEIAAGSVMLPGEWCLPAGSPGIVLFAHGSGSSRYSPRNQAVARVLQAASIGTLLFDLLTRKEEALDARDGHLRFDIGLLAGRLIAATRWVQAQPQARRLRIGYFGSSTGGAAALLAAVELGSAIAAVVSRGGRPDLAEDALSQVKAPTLLIVGEYDEVVWELNRDAFERLHCEKKLTVVPHATHLFGEPGALGKVAQLAAAWFGDHLKAG